MEWGKFCPYNTRLEKRLILFVAVLSVVVLVLFICLLSSAHEPNTCKTPECVRASVHILDTVDPTVNPCDDFYNFACGTFLKNAFSLGQPTPLALLKIQMRNKLKKIIMETRDERNMSRMLVIQRKFYRTCINEDDIEKDDNNAFLKLLDEMIGGWPVVKMYDWAEREFDWVKTMVKARKLGFYFEFYLKVDVLAKNGNYLWIRPPAREEIAVFNLKDENVNAIANIATSMGAKSVDTLKYIRSTVFLADQLDLIIQKHFNVTTKQEDDKLRKIAIKDLDHKYIKIDWFNFLRNITGLRLSKEDEVVFDVEEYLVDLYYLLMKTPKKVQASYMAWAVISTSTDYMTKEIRDEFKKIEKPVNRTRTKSSRNDECATIATGLFRGVAEGEYIRRYTPPEKRRAVKEIIDNIKDYFKESIRKSTWMEQETTDEAIRYINNITEAVGWTDIAYDSEKFERGFGYHQVKMTSNKLIDMARKMAHHSANRYYRKLLISDKDEVEEYLNQPKLEVNAYYMKYFNKLILPASILQGLMFDDKRPNYMNYGALGSIVGHEFTHGITYNFFAEKNASSWSKKSTENFENSARCLIDQYDTYINQMGRGNNTKSNKRNGTATLEENLSDVIGINLAYKAYQRWVTRNRPESMLPGVKFTTNQFFWIMASTYLCHDPNLDENDTCKNDDRHGISSFRVVGPIRNSPYFAKDWNCPVGSRMNPEDKCLILT